MGKARASKRKRIKKLFPRQFGAGYISVHPTAGTLAKDHDVNPFTFRNLNKNANRTVSVQQPDGSFRRHLAPVPVTQELTVARAIGPNAVPRAVVLCSTYQSPRHQNPEPWHCICVQDCSRWKIVIWFSGGRAIILKESKRLPRTIERSIIYNGFKTAKLRFDQDRVRWCDPVNMDALPEYPQGVQPPPG